MKKRLLAFLLAVSIAVSMLVMPASAAGNNTAVQFAITLGAMDSEQSGALNAAVTRGAFARMLTSYLLQYPAFYGNPKRMCGLL